MACLLLNWFLGVPLKSEFLCEMRDEVAEDSMHLLFLQHQFMVLFRDDITFKEGLY